MDRNAFVRARPPSPTARPSSRRSRSARRPARRRRPGAARCGSSPSRCCRRPARRRACRSSSCGRTTRSTASRCRCGCSPRLPRGPGTSRSRPRGAPLPTKTASQPSASSAFMLSMRCAGAELDAEVEDVAHLLVDHAFGQPELRESACASCRRPCASPSNTTQLVAERREIARDGQRRRARRRRARCACRSSARPACGSRVADVFLEVGGDALQAADRDRLGLALPGVAALLDAAAAARGLAGTVAGAPENAGKDVRFPVDEVGVAVAARGDQADVFGNGRYGPGTPTGNRRPCGNSRVARYPSASNTSPPAAAGAAVRRDATPRPLRGKESALPRCYSHRENRVSCRTPRAHMAVECVRSATSATFGDR